MTLAIFGNRYQNFHARGLRCFFDTLKRLAPEAELLVDADFDDYLRQTGVDTHGRPIGPGDDSLARADIAMSFGGDGTFLRTARRIAPRQIPIIGVNTGHLGYLAAVSPADPGRVVNRLLSGAYCIEERAMLAVTMTDPATGGDIELGTALNEVAVLKQDTASMVMVAATLNGSLLADYRADGLIVSTPTGSTGYNLSVGGPIVAPGTGVWVISPIAAHTLTMRPMVVADSSVVTLNVSSRTGSFLLSLDGESTVLPAGSVIKVAKAPFVTKIIVGESHAFVDSLREKLLWGMS